MLTINYKDGSTQVVHPRPEFYVPLHDKNVVYTVADKARSIARSLGNKKPISMTLYEGNKLIVLQKFEANINAEEVQEKIDEKEIKKQLRNQFKKVPFKGRERFQF